MGALIRRAQAGDGESLARLNGFVHDLHLVRRPDYFKATRSAEVAARFESLLTEPDAHLWIAECDGLPAGYALALFQSREEGPFSMGRRWCEVDQIAVDLRCRRRGVARALVDALARAAAAGIDELKANTWAFNDDARRAFASLGFEVESLRLRRGPVP